MFKNHQLKVNPAYNRKTFKGGVKIFSALMLVAMSVNFVVAGVVQAQSVGNVGPAPAMSQDIGKEVKLGIGGALALGVFKMFQYALNKAAYDAAEYLATGDFDKGPLIWTDPWQYTKDTADSAVGEGIVSLSDNIEFFKKYKINLCIPQDPNFQLWLKLSLAKQVNPPYSRCKVTEALKSYKDKFSSLDVLKNVGIGMAPGENQLSITAGVIGTIYDSAAKEKEKAKVEIETKGASKPPEQPISKEAADAKEAARQAKLTAEQKEAEAKAAKLKTIEDSFVKGEYSLISFGTMAEVLFGEAKDIFLNKALTTLLAKVPGGFLNAPVGKDLLDKMLADNNLLNEEGQGQPPRPVASAADIAFGGYQSVKLVSAENYNYTAEMADCTGRQSALSCTIDAGLQAALSQALLGDPLTIREAMDNGIMLHKDWLLKNQDADQCASAYCYGNLAKLRFWRIFPIGLEIAANMPGNNTLDEVVKGFSQRGPDGKCGTNDGTSANPESQFCNLVDPDWIIKAPLTRCGALGYGSFIEKDTNIRQQYCAQPQHCVNEDDNGNCIGESNWGYCLREKNIWRLGGTSCDAQFNTCTLYAGGSGKRAAYLDNTINRGICNADNAGCRAYSVTKSSAGVWETTDPKSYFNSKAEKCDAQNEGCSKFLDLSGKEISLKKAPAYAKCYGEPLSFVDNWPQNKADLYKLDTSLSTGQKQNCSRFASVCSKEEAGCESYKSADKADAPIPGSLSSADRCDSQCVGYAKYKEQKLTLFSGIDDAYFIANTAKSCSAENVGCEAFVNLDTTSAGGETKEYYTELRACSKVEAEGDTFYTWEGSDTAGYQLKSYQLKKDGDGVSAAPVSTLTIADLASVCSETIYAGRNNPGSTFNADCREFYNRAGAKLYRLYSRTVTVSPTECKRMRASSISKSVCDSFGVNSGASWSDSLGCVYMAIPQEGKICSAEFNGCRAYRGNTGHNFQSFLTKNFQGGRPGQVLADGNQYSAEALEINGVSLKVNSAYVIATSTVAKKSVFTISFWAKGSASAVRVSAYPSDVSGAVSSGAATMVQTQTNNLYNDWRSYTVGPFVVEWDSASLTGFKIESNSAFFLDNIIIKKMTDNVYVIKDSWKTPVACDAPVAQYQLGCQAYTDSKNVASYAKFFTSLCRPEAVGCQELIDVKNVTGNTTSSPSRYYNALCSLASSATNNTNISAPCKDSAGVELCLILPGKQSCRFNYVGNLPTVSTGVIFSNDMKTLIISNAAIVYLVNNEKGRCANENQGCRALGLIDYNSNNQPQVTVTTYLKDQPDKYGTIFCQPEAEKCEEFVSSKGGTAYFVDPALQSGKLCEWKDNIGSGVSGWVIKGTTSRCYPTAAKPETIWPVGSTDYEQKVGLCPEKQDGCSEFVDPMSSDQLHSNIGTPYYVINDDKLDRSTCQGVSKSKGCVLFNETSRGVSTWNTAVTYNASQAQGFNLVNPVNCGVNGENNTAPCLANDISDKNNANVILKVRRDRVCSEWLACKSFGSPVWDPINGKTVHYCNELARCDKPASAATVGSNSCGSPGGLLNHFYNDRNYRGPLTTAQYQKRPVGWEGQDFSGYTIPWQYSPEDLDWINILGGEVSETSETNEVNLRLVKKIPTNDNPVSFTCSSEGTECGLNNGTVPGTYGKGKCKGGICVQTAYGETNFGSSEWNKTTPPPQPVACRTYPEMSSPFPNLAAVMDTATSYRNVNFCQQSGTQPATGTGDIRLKENDMTRANACDCNYTKRVFGGVDKYLSKNSPADVHGLCVGGPNDGLKCSVQSNCGAVAEGGTCLLNFKETKLVGWKGVCLQYDFSRKLFGAQDVSYNFPCLTWWPVDKLKGVADSTAGSQRHDAGFDPVVAGYVGGGPYYCLDDARWDYRQTYPLIDRSIIKESGNWSLLASYDCHTGPTQGTDAIIVNSAENGGENAFFDGSPVRIVTDSTSGNFIFKHCDSKAESCNHDYVDGYQGQFINAWSTACNSEYYPFLKRMQRRKHECTGFATKEDYFYLDLECVPKDGAGWRGYVSGTSVPHRKEEQRCVILTSVSGQNGENKAKTNAIWMEQKKQITCPNAAPGGALTINMLPDSNVMAVLKSDVCLPNSRADSTHVAPPANFFLGGQKKTITQIQSYFAKGGGNYGVFQMGYSNGYITRSDSVSETWDITSTAGNPPIIISLGNAVGTGGNYKEGRTNHFTLDNQDSGDVKRISGAYVSLKFFYFANPDHMPVKQVRAQFDVPMTCSGGTCNINTGGGIKIGESDSGTDWFMNYRGLDASGNKKCVAENVASNFGLIESKTCLNGYFDASYMFTCQGSGSSGWNATCPDPSVTGGCCVFKPRVQVLDNWDWCNGTCSNGANGGCYNQGDSGHRKACTEPQTGDNPWLEYSDRVIVIP